MIKSLGRLFVRLVASHVELHPTEKCPDCGSQLARELERWGERPREPVESNQDGSPGVSPHPPDEWRCLNPDCPPQVLKRLQLWVAPAAMNLEGFDAALVAQLAQCGLVRDAAEFYQLNEAELVALDGVDEAKARALVAAIEASKQREAWRVLFGLGIRSLGSAEAQALCGQFATLQELFTAGRNPMPSLTGVNEAVIQQLKRWLGDPVNRKLVRRLAKAGINFDTRDIQSSKTR